MLKRIAHVKVCGRSARYLTMLGCCCTRSTSACSASALLSDAVSWRRRAHLERGEWVERLRVATVQTRLLAELRHGHVRPRQLQCSGLSTPRILPPAMDTLSAKKCLPPLSTRRCSLRCRNTGITLANASIAAAFCALVQRWLVGVASCVVRSRLGYLRH